MPSLAKQIGFPFVKGDMVVLKWPNKSRWPDTMQGVNNGTLVVGKQYEVVDIHHTHSYGGTYEVSLRIHENGRSWMLTYEALELVGKIKYNLPDWF